MSLTEINQTAFEVIIQRYQEAKVLGGLHAMTVDPDKADFDVKTTAVPSVSDFVCDVGIAIKRALTETEQRYVNVFYSVPGYDPATMVESVAVRDEGIRDRLGARFIEVGIYPLEKYVYGI